MSKHPFFLRWMSLPLATVLGVALTMTAQTQVLGMRWGPAPWVRLDGFTQADGGNVFALTLKPSVPAATGPRDVVILVSTAASQTGDYRSKSLATLQSTLAKLRAERSRQARGLRPERDAADPRVCGPQQCGDGQGPHRARTAHSAGLLRPGKGPGCGREELRRTTASRRGPSSISAMAAAAPTCSPPINSTAWSTTWLPSGRR